MDNADEAILFYKKKSTLKELQKTIQTELAIATTKLYSSSEYKKLKAEHKEYLSNKKIKKTTQLIEKIIILEHEKNIAIINNKEHQFFIAQKNLFETATLKELHTPFYTNKNQLKSIYKIQIDLFTAPIEFLTL